MSKNTDVKTKEHSLILNWDIDSLDYELPDIANTPIEIDWELI